MFEFKILYISSDIDKAKTLVSECELSDEINFVFSDSGIEALSLVSDYTIKLIIIHKELSHKMNGIEVCELLMKNSQTANIPVILINQGDEDITTCKNVVKRLDIEPNPEMLQTLIRQHYHIGEEKHQLQIEKNLVLSIVNKIHAPIFIIDHSKISFVNQYFLDFFHLSSLNELPTQYPKVQDLFLHEREEQDFSLIEWLKELLSSQEEQKIVMQNNNGDILQLKIRGELLEHSNEYLIITQDITSEVAHTKEIEELYNIDPLTKLPNRLKLLKDLDTYDELALAIFDIDDFKNINDFYGHIIGDFIITEVAKRILHYISHENLILYRLPSDSFAVININHIEKEYFEIIILSLIQIISKTPFIYVGEDEEIEIFANVTAGIVFNEKNSALAQADIALIEAKNTHKDYMVYHNEMRQEIVYKNNMEWVHKIKRAITNDKIVPYFQPIINNETQETVKYECLIRLIDEQGEVISPFFFLEIAKRAKLYEPLTKIMIKKSFQTFISSDYEFSINLSIEDITDYNLSGYIKSMLSIYPLAGRVCFEILETEKIMDYQIIADFVSEVRDLGCKVSIDDFGSGYSNFSHLLNLNFDYLKIDASLIQDIHQDKHKQIIVKTIVTFAKELGIKTIGEYVESKEIYDFITKMGINYSQGYYFSPPVDTIS